MSTLISQAHRDRVERYIKAGQEEGGDLLIGGDRPLIKGHENGYFLNPAVIYTDNDVNKEFGTKVKLSTAENRAMIFSQEPKLENKTVTV